MPHHSSVRNAGSVVSLFLAAAILLATCNAQSKDGTPVQPVAVKTPGQAPATPVAPDAAPAPAPEPAPEADSVMIFPGAPQNSSAKNASTQNTFILEFIGKNFGAIKDMGSVRVIPFPATGVSSMTAPLASADGTKLFVQFVAPVNYVLEQVALSVTGSSFFALNTGAASCDFENRVKVRPEILPLNQSDTKYGDGIGKNFYVIQISIVNKCAMPIDVPLAGIRVVAEGSDDDDSPCRGPGKNSNLIPFSLDHLTSVYSEDRKLTGKRAMYFNILQATATIGSSIEPFLARGFTQAVAILGGGFTTASKEVFVDMSAEQLQNITSQSFGSVEQVAAGGSLQKFIFIPRIPSCAKEKPVLDAQGKPTVDSRGKQIKKASTLNTNLVDGKFIVHYDLIPASAQAPETQSSPAVSTDPDASQPAPVSSPPAHVDTPGASGASTVLAPH